MIVGVKLSITKEHYHTIREDFEDFENYFKKDMFLKMGIEIKNLYEDQIKKEDYSDRNFIPTTHNQNNIDYELRLNVMSIQEGLKIRNLLNRLVYEEDEDKRKEYAGQIIKIL